MSDGPGTQPNINTFRKGIENLRVQPVPLQLRTAEMRDAQQLFDWRNESSTRRASFSSQPIEFYSHVKWLEASLKNPDREIWLASLGNTQVGTCRLDFTPGHKTAEVSWTIGEAHRRKRFATYMLSIVLGNTKCDHFIAKIKTDNWASRKLAANLGFQKVFATDDYEQWEWTPAGSP